jgi:crossover junction endodeoxyribonuclease RuvC
MIVLGIDPGASNMGFGVVERRGSRLLALDGGAIETAAGAPLERRLARIHERLEELIAEYRPVAMAVEDLYFGHNVRSALSVGQARGVAVLAAGINGLDCFHYTPQAIKKAVCGAGKAEKGQVQRMVQALLSLAELPKPDHAADALAVAICHLGSVGVRSAVDNRAVAAKEPMGALP